eukprot:TRINITY_DN3460_c0_g1_i1.p1 TRINITY_DN3460_c0_g1~~TRINITY_DN3460_c0_g1_i1.p1  ORF type:complete len:331 (-),score=89.60 TRINITY_DN3460_c0_g1_i1:295-1242(-)
MLLPRAALLCCLLACVVAFSPEPPIHKATLEVGPYNLAKGQHSFSVPSAPYPPDAGGILFWGGWVVRDVDSGEVVGEGGVFLHHIMLFGKNKGSNRMLITGSSDERATFGPQLHHPYYLNTDELTVAGSVLLVGYEKQRNVKVEYDIEYVKKHDMPNDARFAISFSHAITITVPMDDEPESKPLYKHPLSRYRIPTAGILLSMVGHLHVGGEAIRVYRDDTAHADEKLLFCASIAEHHYDVPCFIECPTKCHSGAPTFPALKSLTSCTDEYVWMPEGSFLYLEASYHSECSFTGCHAQAYHWFYPTSDPNDLMMA